MDMEQLHAEKMLLLQALNDSRRVGAIKAVRAITGAGLLEAKTVVDAVFDAMVGVPAPCIPAHDTLNHNDARYVVVQTNSDSYNGSAVIDTFHGSPNSFNEAIDYARSRIECDRDVTVAKVIATTKRSLQVL